MAARKFLLCPKNGVVRTSNRKEEEDEEEEEEEEKEEEEEPLLLFFSRPAKAALTGIENLSKNPDAPLIRVGGGPSGTIF